MILSFFSTDQRKLYIKVYFSLRLQQQISILLSTISLVCRHRLLPLWIRLYPTCPRYECVCVCLCVCVSKWKESARRMASTTSENRKRKEKKSTEQEEAHFVSRVTVILTREKERDYLLNLHMSQSICFGTWIETGVDFYGWQLVPVQCKKENM